MTEPIKPERCQRIQEQLPDLALGQLRAGKALQVVWHCKRCPACEAEWQSIRSLYTDLRTLQTEAPERPAPRWPVWANDSKAKNWVIGGWVMKRRVVIAASAVLLLASVSCGFAARQWFFQPYRDLPAGNGRIWRAEINFRGEVRFFDAEGKPHGSVGSSDGKEFPVTANVSVNGAEFPLRGKGRHPLRDASGTLLGYADLVPETIEERKRLEREHDHAMGYEVRYEGSCGAIDGYGQATGYFGEPHEKGGQLNWKLSGVGRVRIALAENGKVLRTGIAGPVTAEQREELKSSLGADMYAMMVADTVPTTPVFTWANGKATGQHIGYGSFLLTLPNGMKVTVTVLPPASE